MPRSPREALEAFGLNGGDFEFPTKHFFYALKDFQPLPWVLREAVRPRFFALSAPSKEEAERLVDLVGEKPLTGVPSSLLEVPVEGQEQEETVEGEPPVEGPKKLTEVVWHGT